MLQGSPAGGFRGDDAQINPGVIPEGMGIYHVGDHCDENRTAWTQRAHHGVIRKWVRRYDQVAGVPGDQALERLPHIRPGKRVEQACPAPAVTQVITGSPDPGCFDHQGINRWQCIEGERRIVFQDIDHFRADAVLVFEPQRFDDSFRRRAVTAACVGEQEQDVGALRN